MYGCGAQKFHDVMVSRDILDASGAVVFFFLATQATTAGIEDQEKLKKADFPSIGS